MPGFSALDTYLETTFGDSNFLNPLQDIETRYMWRRDISRLYYSLLRLGVGFVCFNSLSVFITWRSGKFINNLITSLCF